MKRFLLVIVINIIGVVSAFAQFISPNDFIIKIDTTGVYIDSIKIDDKILNRNILDSIVKGKSKRDLAHSFNIGKHFDIFYLST